MLQQTTVAAVRKRYDDFLRRFPDVGSIARASEEDVLAAWSGLGYYARARNLRLAAQSIVREHGGTLPRETAALRGLPGFGPYMAAAVASLAHGARVPAAEANVERVLARVFALDGVAGSSGLRAGVLAAAETLLPKDRPGDLTAALMDLGQLVCTPRRPICPACPLESLCEARRRDEAERFPARAKRPPRVHLSLAAALVRRSGRVLLVRRRSTWLDGMWEFPSAEGMSPSEARRKLARRIFPLGFELSSFPAIAMARHTVVNRRIEIAVFGAKRSRPPGRRGDREGRWFLPRELDAAAVPTLTRKIAAAALGAG